jgi:DHA2 family multidrug resistance protein-like MFS transporter
LYVEMTDSAAAPAKAGRREWIGLGVIALPCLLYSMDLTVLFLAIPSLTRDLAPSATQLLWISDVYGFMVAGSLITMGTLGDRIGRRKLLLVGAALFGVASVLAAFSRTAEMLIATRALLGVAGATVAPSTLSLIRNMFHDERERTFAIGIWITAYSVGGLIGPVVGGVMLEKFWWGSVFLLALPVMALLLIAGPKLLPEYRDPNAGRLDLFSAAQSLVAVLAVIYGLKRLAADGVGVLPVATMVAGIIVGILFVRRQQRLADPLIDLGLFRIRELSASLITYLLTVFVFFGVGLYIAQYFQLVLGLSPLRAGLWSLPSAACFIVGSLLSSRIIQRFRPANVMAVCLLITAAGFAMMTQVEVSTSPIYIVAATIVYSIAGAPVVTLTTDIVVGSAPPERAGAASAISETSAEFGGALSVALLGSIGTAVYRAGMRDVPSAGVTADAMEAARSTLGGALETAQQLPPAVGEVMTQTARASFVDGLVVAATASLVLVLIAAAIAKVALRHLPPRSQPAH